MGISHINLCREQGCGRLIDQDVERFDPGGSTPQHICSPCIMLAQMSARGLILMGHRIVSQALETETHGQKLSDFE